MRIALFTSNRTTIPPQKGIIAASATLTGQLADGLVERGHDVTLYAPRGSSSKATIIDLDLPPSNLDYALQPEEWVKNMNLATKQQYLSELYRRAVDYDLIHLQTEPVYLGMPFARLVSTPTIVTNHNIVRAEEKDLLSYYKDVPLVTISHYQASMLQDRTSIATIYDGIDITPFPFHERASDEQYLYFMGRLVAQKGVKEAIQAAHHTEKVFKLSGVGTQQFISETITPFVSETMQFLGTPDRQAPEWYDLLGKAKAFLFPLQWEEPFGLVTVEAMACGTPVIAYARGAVPELVIDGKTGFIVNPSDSDIRGEFIIKQTGQAGIEEAIHRLYALSKEDYTQMRRQAREHVQQSFTIESMVAGYEQVYQQLLS